MKTCFLTNNKNKTPLLLSLLFSLIVTFLIPCLAQAGQVRFTWDPNPPEDEIEGYRLYFGTVSSCEVSTVGSFLGISSTKGASPISIPVSDLMDPNNPGYDMDGLSDGTWCFRLAAYNNALEESELSSPVSMVIDDTAPLISITSPTASPVYSTMDNRISIGGTSSDSVCIGSITWENSLGGSGTASGTADWSQDNIALQAGDNVITFAARDCEGHVSTASLTVTYISPCQEASGPIVINTLPNTYFNADSIPPRIDVDFCDADGLKNISYRVGNTGNWMPIFLEIATHSYKTDFAVTGCSDGINEIYFQVTDKLNNVYEPTGTDTLTILLDTTLPTGTINIE